MGSISVKSYCKIKFFLYAYLIPILCAEPIPILLSLKRYWILYCKKLFFISFLVLSVELSSIIKI